ncbi:MAG: sugar ABC transporter permease [Bacilli bacterium]|nr:sugar ABC transporter permease [Bacilli bacterium]
MLYPIINTVLYAFIQNYSYETNGGNFALGQFFIALNNGNVYTFGFDNFANVLQEESFVRSIGNTAILTIVEVPLTIIVSLLIATFLNNIKVLKGFYQTIFFLPYVTNTIALGLIFNLTFANSPGGLMNIVLMKVFGYDQPINWLNIFGYNRAPAATRFHQGVVIVLYSLWNGIAFKILVFMSGLATIDKQYSDAAKIDGASNFTIWRRITLPLLSPQILYITVTSFIGSFKMYTGVMAVYQKEISGMEHFFGGPDGDDWITVVGWIYRNVQSSDTINSPGDASAASLILLGIIMVITAVQFLVSKKRVHY